MLSVFLVCVVICFGEDGLKLFSGMRILSVVE